VDEGQFDRFGELFTADVVYDVSALGGGLLSGIEAIARAGLSLGDANPLAHHVTNVVVQHVDAHGARVRSKGLAVGRDGSTGSVVYDDELRRTDGGWRIAVRRVLPRTAPLRPSGAAPG
jgi:hypothetical protein